MQDLILEGDFDVNYLLLSSLLEKMSSISDLYLLPLNQLVPSPTHFSHTCVSSIIHLCSSQASATHWNTYQPFYFPLIYIPSSHHYHPSNIKIPFSLFPLPQNCGTLFHSTLECLHLFPPKETLIQPILPKFYYLIPGNNPLQAFTLSSFIINSFILYLAMYA